jgi:hypothetical protein
MAIAAFADPPQSPQPMPTPFPQARYQQLIAKSPFAVPTVTAAAPAATPDFAMQLYVQGVAHMGAKDFVAIKSRDLNKPVTLFVAVGDSTSDGMRVDGIRWSDVSGKSTVDVSKAGEKATLEFDEATLKSAPGSPDAATAALQAFRPLDPRYADQGDGRGPPRPFNRPRIPIPVNRFIPNR